MKKTIFLSIIVCAMFGNAIAQTTKKESIKKLFVLMNQDSLMQKTFDNIPMFANNPLTGQAMDSTKLEQSKAVMKQVKQMMSDFYPKIQADMIDYYDKYFTQEEINDYIRFYSSAAGQKMIHVTPLITKEMMSSFQTKYMNEMISSLLVHVVKPQVVNIIKPTLKPDSASVAQMKAEYLDMETANSQNMTVEQKQIYQKAINRIERYVDFENNQYVLKVSKASDLNMSERLFELMKNTINQSNRMLESIKKVEDKQKES